MRRILLLAILGLSGCQSAGYFYETSTGKRVDSDPKTLARFQPHKTECDGEAAKAALTSNRAIGEHNRLVNMVYHGCMRGRGYEVRPQ